ncbi:hypothetical protein IQ235_12260 [Oscillatoriales cyanobacterium LEGE 11467]|uniref:Uncharacterized protein n=1 Tax=Zarconia navalis LEGE 11467 TaxID=1828826 RepID=A0A928VYD2_9CYAN|nr:hypothetical protein [Zarconia navalis]MBE9041553.1 hypothetical protein [Zarconia navalis LEGE 11467]
MILLGSTIGLALGIPAALRRRNASVILRSIAGAVVGTIVGVLLAVVGFEKLSGNSLGGGLMLMWFVLPGIVSVTAIVAGELAIFWFERSRRRH